MEVVYAQPARQRRVPVRLAADSTVAEAVLQSGILAQCPDLGWPNVPVGIFGRTVSPEHQLNDGDRVEIYRPLIVDPKERRRRRAG